MNRRHEESRLASLEHAKADIAQRVKRVCVEMSEEEFDRLVGEMATLKIKYTLRRSDDMFRHVDDVEPRHP